MGGRHVGRLPARSARDRRWRDLVYRAAREPPRAHRSENRRDQGVPDEIPDSGPHGLTADAAGNIWFTANSAAYIGKLDPKSGAISAYPMPDTRARDPHTPIFDHKGVLWFTVQGANMIGRLVPRTGQIRLVQVPSAHALPYGMVVSSKGVPFFAEFGTNRIGEIDPDTMAIHEHTLPNSACAAAPPRDRRRRHHLVLGLRTRLSRPFRPAQAVR